MIGLNNKKIGFIVDSSSAIKDGQIEDVKVIPLGITVNENGQLKTYKDGLDFHFENLRQAFEKGYDVKTSQASMPDMMKACDEMFKNYDYVIVLPIHKNLSGNINTWRLLKNEFPNLIVVMSCDITNSFIWTIEALKEYLKTHECSENLVQAYVESDIIPHRFGMLMVEDLSQLVKGGRVSGLKAALAKIFKINPIILFNSNGLTNFDKAKNYSSFFKIVNKYQADNYPNTKKVRTFLGVPPGYEDMAKEYIEEYKKYYGDQPFELTSLPLVVVCHTGLKHVCIYFEVR